MNAIDPYRLKISQLRALVAVAKLGRFSEAALQLELSQSAVSHAIATLEEELGVVLLQRGRNGATLTSIGEQILSEARQVLQLIEEIANKAQLARGLRGGKVRVASFRSVDTHILPPVIAQFRRAFPEIAVSISEHKYYDEVEEELRTNRADIGFTYLPTSNEFETWELFRDEYVVLFPPLETPPSAPTWEQLGSYPLILTPKSRGCRRLICNHFAQFGQTLKVAYEVREDSTIISMVRQGLGATVIARLAAEPIPDGLPVFNLPAPLERIVGVAVLANALHPPSVFAFLNTLKAINSSHSVTTASRKIPASPQ